MTPRTLTSLIARAGTMSCLAALSLCAGMQTAGAAGADISNTPLAYSTTLVKPNIMFILDDSGSMGSEYMPDDMYWVGYFGYFASQCNGLAFNPNSKYKPPIKADGTSYPNVSFSAAPDDGYNSSSSTTDLGDNNGVIGVSSTTDWRGRVSYFYTYGPRQYYTYSGTQPVMNWTYSNSGSVDSSTTFYRECNSWIDSANGTSTPGSNVFTKVLIKDQSSDLKQSYANWYSYYRSRLNTMRSAAGHAFSSLDSNYRIGFTMISDSSVSGNNFLDVADFNSTQKTSFYNKLYGSYSGSWTPLRGALSKVGRYYGNRISGQTDPVQHSCQRNYAILSTDGYWNNQIETSSYGPYQLDGLTSVGNQDGTELRPMKDGSTTITTKVDTQSTVVRTSAVVPITTTFTRTSVNAASTSGSCPPTRGGSSTYSTTVATQSCSTNWDRTTVIDATTTTTSTTVTTNGISATPTQSTRTTTNTVSQTSRPGCTGWTTTSSSTQCRSNNFLSNNYGITAGGSTTADGTPSDSAGTGTTTTLSTTVNPATSTETTSTTNGDSNSLADVAQFYWKTDLRSDFANNVAPNSNDTATHQHMNTFTLGLGVRGTVAYESNYQTQSAGDFAAIKAGTKDWPVPIGTVNSGDANATHIDDLWHAAVNGRGQYFSALDPSAVSASISSALDTINAETGTASAAAASSLTPVSGDDWIFLPSYTTLTWTGDLRAFKYTFENGRAVPPSDTSDGREIWSARKKLDAKTYTDRTIYFNRSGSLSTLSYSNLTTAQKTHFDNRCTTASDLLSQCSSLSDNAKAKVTGTNLVNYLRGDKSLYLNLAAADDRVFRARAAVLGDIANAAPVYMGKPPFQYNDAGYASYAAAQLNRTKVVFVAANDGFLHAFKVGTGSTDTTGGTELWAFMPSAVMPNVWRLASDSYTDNHRFFVDATPSISDVYDSANSRWRTILVGGLGAGGRGYYALDVTDPEAPTLLWEIDNSQSDFANLGLTYGNPVITKNKAGTWVVAFTSGLNNHTNGGSGVGRLYIVNALTGARISDIVTSAGDSTTPNNLNRIDGWVESASDNKALRFYGGDLLGNLWRFDHDDLINPSGSEAMLLGKARTSSGTAQPISVKPVLMSILSDDQSRSVVLFGTGRYLGGDDLTDTTTQTIYAVKDSLGSSGLDVLRTGSDALVQQTLNSNRTVSSGTLNTVDWTTQNGWFIDLNVTANSGERVFVDPIALTSTTVQVSTGITTGTSVCTPGGNSWIYALDLTNGNVSWVTSSTFLVVGMSTVINPDNTASSLINDVKGQLKSGGTVGLTSGSGRLKRAIWRELVN